MRPRAERTAPFLTLGLAALLLAPSLLVVSPIEGAANTASSGVAPSFAAAQPAASSAFSNYRAVGGADPNMSVLVSIAIPLRNLPLLSSLVKESSDPSSSGFHHFLTYDQISQKFLPTQGQYQAVVDYLTSRGFQVESSALNSMIVARGTASQVSEYLGQNVQLFTNGTYTYYQTEGASTLSGAYSFASNSTGLFMRPDFTTGATGGSARIPASNVTFTEGGQETKLLRSVYNSTGLLSSGDNGSGYTVGLLDFYGYSLIGQDLALYDKTYGYPAPPSFTVAPIGPYNPNLGSSLGWDGEIDLDVQVSHAMAPGANIVLYAANGGLPLSTAIAQVVQDGKVNVLSQSFGIPEWEYYQSGPTAFLFNAVFVDDYYMLGSAMGISFLASSGDGGGSGFSVGPQGGASYPSSSPYVTSLGGTTTYVSKTASGALSFNQTGWSNLGFVPYFANEGGGGGGVSILEPKPWYQSSQQVPASFPEGRMAPDLSLDASGNPGTFVIYQGSPAAFGGTSESSPLFAGLTTLLMGAENGSLGLLNPVLYRLGDGAKTYQQAFTPITFGYTIPWVSKFGYNLATGWGAPNIGEMATLFKSQKDPSALTVNVGVLGAGASNFTDYRPGQNVSVVASVVNASGSIVAAGTFTASLQTLDGSSQPVPLTFNPACNTPYHPADCWAGTITVGDQSGIAYIDVSGTSAGGQTGEGFAPTFLGYLANFVQPIGPYPWTYLPGLLTAVSVTDLFGNRTGLVSLPIDFESYSILSNSYSTAGASVLNYSSGDGYFQGDPRVTLPSGPTTIVAQGAVVGYLPFVNGISLLGTNIYPQMVAEPGSVAPGQSLTVVAEITAPENIYFTQSLASGTNLGTTIAEGANVTAALVSPSGSVLENVSLPERTCAQALRVCGGGLTLINGYVPIPANSTAGLYTVLLTASYNDETTGFIYSGTYYGQVYVAPSASLPKITVAPSTLFEGEKATIRANIAYADGREVTHGVYTAMVYPETAQGDYSSLMHSAYSSSELIPLAFDANSGLWIGSVTIPSPYNSSLVSSTNPNSEYYGGPYEVYVSGISADAVPTSADPSAQQSFNVEPYVWTSNVTLNTLGQTSRLALSNVTIDAGTGALTLSGDYFVGTDTVSGSSVTITSSSVNGTLNIENGATTLNGVTGGAVVVTHAHVTLQHSVLNSLNLGVGATASMDPASSALSIYPPLAVLTFAAPAANSSYTGTVDARLDLGGGTVASLSFFLDGTELTSLSGSNATGPVISYPIDTTSLPDGTHTLTVTAVQSDLLTSTASVSFSTRNQLNAVEGDLAAANQTIGSLSGNLSAANGSIVNLHNRIDSLSYVLYLVAGVAVAAVALAFYALRGRAARPGTVGPSF